jgi:hypothetical protein
MKVDANAEPPCGWRISHFDPSLPRRSATEHQWIGTQMVNGSL